MGTVKYHIENLLDAGLLEIRETRYSVKGREIKVYGLKDQLLIVAPRVQNIRSLLLKYATLFGIIILASVAAYAMLPILSAPPGMGGEDVAKFQGERSVGIMAEPAPSAVAPVQGLALDPVLAFFLGGCLVIILLIIYEVAVWRRLK